MKNSYISDQLKVTLSDGVDSHVTLYQPKSYYSYLLLCLPAMGVRAKFYHILAQSLTQYNLGVICIGWRGTEKSSAYSPKKNDWGWDKLLTDLHEQYLFIEQHFPKKKLILMGHSLGGQIALLYKAQFKPNIDQLVLFAACAPYYKAWSGLNRLKIFLVSLVFPLVAYSLGYFPGRKLGFAGTETKTVIKEWARVLRTGNYHFSDPHSDYEKALASISSDLKILSFLLEDDYLAPESANKLLLSKLPKTLHINHILVKPDMLGLNQLNHFNWAKQPEFISKKIDEWIVNGNVKTYT